MGVTPLSDGRDTTETASLACLGSCRAHPGHLRRLSRLGASQSGPPPMLTTERPAEAGQDGLSLSSCKAGDDPRPRRPFNRQARILFPSDSRFVAARLICGTAPQLTALTSISLLLNGVQLRHPAYKRRAQTDHLHR